jgi:hypothetical protein
MATANHGRYVSDAILAMRDPAFTGDVVADAPEAPLRALRLLDAMWGSAHASRPDQREALSDVGVWLERRLAAEPQVGVEILLAEMGWLKRLARHYEAEQEEAEQGQAGRERAGRARIAAVQKGFGQRLGAVERRRREAFAAARLETPPPIAVPVVPVVRADAPLPEVLVVEFKDFNRAREVRKLAAERVKKKREPKEALLTLVGRAPEAAGVQLVCSTTRSEGMTEVMERVRQTAGVPDWHMEAHGMVKEGDVVFVGRLVIGKTV